jgi:type VI secretion system protein ImpA
MPLREDLLNPIPGANPSGENLRYAPVYDKIKEARREDDDAPQGEWQRERKVADFPLVIKLASEALATKSKDLQLAAWLTEAMLNREGYFGLNQGLTLIRGLIENFWDTLYPEIEDGDAELRATSVEWVGSRLDEPIKKAPLTKAGYSFYKFKESRTVPIEQDTLENETKLNQRTTAIADGKLTPEDFDKSFEGTSKQFYEKLVADLDACLEAVDGLVPVCEEKFGEYNPSFSKTRAALEEVRHTANGFLQKKRELEPDEVADTGTEETSEAGDSDTAEGGEERPRKSGGRKVTSIEPVDRDDATSRVIAVAAWLRREDPYSPSPYLLLRGLRWGELRASGLAPDPMLLEPPATQTRQQLKRMALESQWQELLEASENAMGLPCGRAWLDLQRHVVRACEELGSYYEPIGNAVKSELKALLGDFPDLVHSSLTDDTPTANSETQAWLKQFMSEGPRDSQQHSAPMLEDDGRDGHTLGEASIDSYELAQQAARSGRKQEAIEILTGEISRQNSGRGRFQRKMQLAQLCIQMGHEAISKSILEELARTIDRHELEAWESADVVAHALSMLYDCMQNSDGDAIEKQKLYSRICRLDPMQALAHSR